MKNTLLDKESGLLRLDQLLAHGDYDPLRTNDDCIDSARTIRSLFFIEDSKEKEEFQSSDYLINTPSLIKDLFQEQETEEKNPTFFYFENTDPRHAFIIQKIWNGKQCVYRTHQSWLMYLTLGEWERIDEWPNKLTPEILTRVKFLNKDSYGGNLNCSEIKNFLNDFIEYSIKEHMKCFGPPRCTVTKYKLDANKLEKIEIYRKLRSSVKSLISSEIIRLEKEYKGESTVVNKLVRTLNLRNCPSHVFDRHGKRLLANLESIKTQAAPPGVFSKKNKSNTFTLEYKIDEIINCIRQTF